jgi:ABC-type polar amino acid transport system ATPase subunit
VRERQVGFVFQHYALFRHMTVFDNVAFGMRMKPRSQRPSEKAIKAKVTELLKLVQLDWVADRFPAQLSGGQRQRIAWPARLAVEPRVLLLDEPFGALDAKVRKELRRWLRRLHDELHITSIFVTHDQEEALEVADRVVLMDHGKVEQVGTPEEVYRHPASPFVYGFLGSVNLFHGRVDGDAVHVGDRPSGHRQGGSGPWFRGVRLCPSPRAHHRGRFPGGGWGGGTHQPHPGLWCHGAHRAGRAEWLHRAALTRWRSPGTRCSGWVWKRGRPCVWYPRACGFLNVRQQVAPVRRQTG